MREWLSCTHSPFRWLCSHFHSQPWKILDYIPIPIYSRKVIPIRSHSHSQWNKIVLKNSYSSDGEEWFSLKWEHKIIQYYSTHASQSQYTLMKWKWHARDIVWMSGQWLCFPSLRITTKRNLIWYVEKLQREFIPITIALLPFPYFYSHFHSHSHDIVIVIHSIAMRIPWDPWDPSCFHSHAHL